jgi:hypothetical protein
MADITDTRSDEARPIPATTAEPVAPATGRTTAPATIAGRGMATENGRPSDPEEMREEIERTRARMSATLDTIEDRLIEGKREIWARATLQGFRRKVSREPWRSLAIAFAAGYVVAAIRD